MTESGPRQIPLPLDLRTGPSLTNFFAGPNREAQEAVHRIAAGIGERVIYLWGETGTGKSHLLEAGFREASRQHRLVLDLSRRTSRFIQNAIGELDKTALICMDDIDLLAGDRSREEALFHLYNVAETRGSGLLVAGRRNPGGAGFSLPDLGSRLAAGLVLRLHPIDDDTKRMALEQRAREWGFTLPDKVVTFLMRRCQRDMHSLFVVLDWIDQATLVEKRLVTIPFIKVLLEQGFPKRSDHGP
uniref:Regulatory inactivation of DnaA Hda protein n=1 Tax=Candidatus Kentrum sp. MB TaxID=2138164 RepID=A0A451BBI8_9GAMM|nr:MAG: regulatory inactivation of DnaA Hda protein [Candidatus Kentron sp. MB]VFK31722.1 MAG: regulatory inactivation of DnaA Hda protein [Candidatus Kentron sp. MB]VFK75629.1 MAG: regulatory inactivation of DnaA Hda protein [Candidatus Kentron sp. MB]